MALKVLIIGCGNVGAMYDLNDPGKVWTHARAFSLRKGIEFVVADTNETIRERVSAHYKVPSVSITDDLEYSEYDIVSITTPTPTHYDYLKEVLKKKVPVVICEKPVAASAEQLNDLLRRYDRSGSRVLVNYIRRFQPEYAILKRRITGILKKDACTAIVIKYQRGFLNNGSHAFDLLEFLFERPFLFTDFQLQSCRYDAFENDPTVTASCRYEEAPVSIVGVAQAGFPVFEIELFFQHQKIVVCHSGDEIRYYVSAGAGAPLGERMELRQTGILERYMAPVIERAVRLVKAGHAEDNFKQAALLNRRIVKLQNTFQNRD